MWPHLAHPGPAVSELRSVPQLAVTDAIDISVIDTDYAFAETKVLHC